LHEIVDILVSLF